MIVLANRRMRIVLGMPRGNYPSHTREIHELHVFNIIDENDSRTSWHSLNELFIWKTKLDQKGDNNSAIQVQTKRVKIDEESAR